MPNHTTAPIDFAARFAGLVAVLTRRGFARHDAEDAAQNTLIVLLRAERAGRLGAISNVDGWLLVVAERIAAKVAARRLPCAAAALAEVPAPAADEVTRRDEARGVRTQVGRLPDRLRRAVALCELEERTYRQAAAVLGVSAGEVGRRLTLARAALRAALGDARPPVPRAVIAAASCSYS